MGNTSSLSPDQRLALNSLREMGYSDEHARVALNAANGDVNRAVALLLEQTDSMQLQTRSATASPPPAPRFQVPLTREEEARAMEQAIAASQREAATARPATGGGRSAAAAAAEARLAQSANRGVASRAPAARAAPPQSASRPVHLLSRTATPSGGKQTPEQRIQACAARLAGRALAVDTLITSLTRALENPNEEKYRKVNINNKAFQERVASAPGSMEFMYAVGFEPLHGYLVLQNRDPALLWIGKSALEQLRQGSVYQHAKEEVQMKQALQMSESEYSVEASKRRAFFRARVPDEPPEGQAGNSLICFHTGEKQTWRRFESCNTLEDLLNFARSLPDSPLSELRLHNVTLAPAVPLDLNRELGLTLQRLELWPTGHIRVEAA